MPYATPHLPAPRPLFRRLGAVWLALWVLVGLALSGCQFDRADLDERKCDPSDPFSCADGVCSPAGFCVSYDRADFLDTVEPGDTTSVDAAETDIEPLPCGGCEAGEVCCDDVCVEVRNNESHCGACGNVCGANQVCTGADCTCVVGRYDCDGDPANGCETDLLTSTEFCGECGDGMGSSACVTERFACSDGICVCGDAPCADGQDCCGTACVDLAASPNNCGACGTVCAGGENCVGGNCMCGDGAACAAGEQCCRGMCIDPNVTQCDCGGVTCSETCCPGAAGDVCVTLVDDDAHCGACGVVCGVGRTCSNGTCLCAAGTLECGGDCVDIDTDPLNCGTCARDCTAFDNVVGATCDMGACAIQCAEGFADCDGNPTNGCEVEIASDPLNCGACADPMAPVTCFDLPFVDTVSCAEGACLVETCLADRGDCDAMADGCETDLTSTDLHCGTCGNDCASSAGMNEVASCVDSACETECAPGWLDCDGLPGCEVQDDSCRVTDGLIALYTFTEGSGDTATDSSGYGGPLDLVRYNNQNNFQWLSGRNGVRFTGDSGMRATSAQSARIEAECDPPDEITIEAWIEPANDTQGGPARIVTYSADSGNRNFTVGQQGDRWSIRFRTSQTDDNGTFSGTNPIQTAAGTLTTDVTHVVLTFDATTDELILYIDGSELDRVTMNGGLSAWNTGYRFAIGNEVPNDVDRQWRGEMYLVALYDRTLSPAEIAQNYAAGNEF